MGVVACVTNRLLKNRTAHVVVEANPLVIPQLELNRTLNRCQFEIVNRAIAYGMESVTFRPSSNVCISSITAEGGRIAGYGASNAAKTDRARSGIRSLQSHM